MKKVSEQLRFLKCSQSISVPLALALTFSCQYYPKRARKNLLSPLLPPKKNFSPLQDKAEGRGVFTMIGKKRIQGGNLFGLPLPLFKWVLKCSGFFFTFSFFLCRSIFHFPRFSQIMSRRKNRSAEANSYEGAFGFLGGRGRSPPTSQFKDKNTRLQDSAVYMTIKYPFFPTSLQFVQSTSHHVYVFLFRQFVESVSQSAISSLSSSSLFSVQCRNNNF